MPQRRLIFDVSCGFTDELRKDFTRYMRIQSPSKRIFDSVTYKYFSSILREEPLSPVIVPLHYDEKLTKAFHDERRRVNSHYELIDDVLFFHSAKGHRKQVATHDTAFDIIVEQHVAEHLPKKKTFGLVKERAHGIVQKDCYWVINHCLKCNAKRGKSRLPELPEPDKSERPFKRLQLDFVNLTAAPSNGYKWIFIIRDHFSNYAILYPMKNKQPLIISSHLDEFIDYYGPPRIFQHNGDNNIKCALAMVMCNRGMSVMVGQERSREVQQSAEEYIVKVLRAIAG